MIFSTRRDVNTFVCSAENDGSYTERRYTIYSIIITELVIYNPVYIFSKRTSLVYTMV